MYGQRNLRFFVVEGPWRRGWLIGLVSHFLASMLLFFVSCGCSAPVSDLVGDEEIVETSRDEKPEWLGRPMCPDKKVCATGSRSRSSALDFARTDAQADAVKQFARQLESRAKAYFGSNRNEKGLPEVGDSPQVDQVVNELFAMASKVTIQDVRVEDFWWKRYRSMGQDGRLHYYIDYYILVSISESTWKSKVSEVINKGKELAMGANLQKMEEQLEKFGEEVLSD